MNQEPFNNDPYILYRNYDKELYDEVDKLRYSHLTKQERNAKLESIRTQPKINRNSLCPCGSEKKYKFCCGKK